MKTKALQLLFLFSMACRLLGNESTTLLIPQPIVSFGDTEEWTTTGSPDTDEMYMILCKPYFEMHYNGPRYMPIVEKNIMDGTELDCNLLSLYKIKINHEFMSKNVILDLSNAEAEKNSVLTLEIAGYAALECIRIVADRYHHDISVEIVPPKDDEEKDKWLTMQKQFAAHDKSKPFKRKEQAGTGQPAIRPESKSEGGDKPKPKAEGRSR
jgi:hypothetical protein